MMMLQQCVNVMHIFRYDTTYKRLLRKRKNKGPLQWAPEKINTFLFANAKSMVASVVPANSSIIRRLGCNHCLPGEIISLDVN